MNKSKLKKITSARLFLPIVCLIAVLLINVIKTPDFFNITIRNGVLYGYVIDVISRQRNPDEIRSAESNDASLRKADDSLSAGNAGKNGR